MKPRGSHLSYSAQRDSELYDTYKRLVHSFERPDGSIDYNAAILAAVASPCSRYWISEGVAYSKIRAIQADAACLDGMYPQKRLLYQSLYDTFQRLRRDPRYADLSDLQVAYLASDQPAPSFYMGLNNAKIIICRERARRRALRRSSQ